MLGSKLGRCKVESSLGYSTPLSLQFRPGGVLRSHRIIHVHTLPLRLVSMNPMAASCCPFCNSTNLASVQSPVIDSELLECQNCGRAYEVKYGPDGKVRLVGV